MWRLLFTCAADFPPSPLIPTSSSRQNKMSCALLRCPPIVPCAESLKSNSSVNHSSTQRSANAAGRPRDAATSDSRRERLRCQHAHRPMPRRGVELDVARMLMADSILVRVRAVLAFKRTRSCSAAVYERHPVYIFRSSNCVRAVFVNTVHFPSLSVVSQYLYVLSGTVKMRKYAIQRRAQAITLAAVFTLKTCAPRAGCERRIGCSTFEQICV